MTSTNNDEDAFEMEAKGFSTWEVRMYCNKCGNIYKSHDKVVCACGENLAETRVYRRFNTERLSLYIASGGILAIVDSIFGDGIEMYECCTVKQCIEDKNMGKQFAFPFFLMELFKYFKWVAGVIILFIAIRSFKGGQ